jgi:hypothetical protein
MGMIRTLPVVLLIDGERRAFDCDVDFSIYHDNGLNVHHCFIEELPNLTSEQCWTIHEQCLERLMQDLPNIIADIEDTEAESSWELSEDR